MNNFARSSVILMTLRLKIFPVFMYPDCFQHMTAKATHSTMEICAKPSKPQKETNQVTWWSTLKKRTSLLGLPLQLAPIHSWMCALMVGSHHVQCAQEGRVPVSTLRIEDMASAALPKPLHGVGNTPRAQQCLESAWHFPAPEVQLLTVMLCSKQRDAEASLWVSLQEHQVILYPSFPLLFPHARILAMQSSHHSCFSRLSSKCCLRWFSNLPGSCISEISLPAQCPFPGGIHMGHFWGQCQIHHTAGIPALPSWGQAIICDWFFTKAMSCCSSSWGNSKWHLRAFTPCSVASAPGTTWKENQLPQLTQ